jgi:hypothetical protein
MSVGDVSNREERPAYVRFERRPVEDKNASLNEGRYVAKDVDFALITPPYSKDCVEQKVTRWLEDLERGVRDGRIPQQWADLWREGYKKWQNGQEMPLHGTPILGWGVISPAQQKMLIAINCLTVEDLAQVNDEGMKRIGMGALELRNKAKNWLNSVKDHGGLTIQMTALEQENAGLKASLEGLKAQVEALKGMIPQQSVPVNHQYVEEGISASDLLDDEPAPITSYMRGTSEPAATEEPKRRGRPPKTEQQATI